MPRTKGSKNKKKEVSQQIAAGNPAIVEEPRTLAPAFKVKEPSIVFFSEQDMTVKDGKKIISSEYPMWYNPNVVDEIEEDIRRDEYVLRMGYVKEAQLPQVKERLAGLQKKLEAIRESEPKLTDAQKDRLDRVSKNLGEEIKNKMFTYSQMMKGTADPHAEAQRMVTPSIPVDKDIAQLAEACNVRVVDGKISRDGASKIWKISRRALGDMSDCEELRRD